MNQRQLAFRRKVIYIISICLLLSPLFILGQPATTSSDGAGSPGGVLARMREDNDLAQSSLGEIDPASETMKLATLGLRGVAANLLWEKANEYKMKKNWDKLSVTLNQIIKIQPNFMSVWEFQAHNLSYNVSAEFDDYQYRYHWVKKGMYFLMSGIAYNKRDYRILTNLGQFFGTKMGRSDERIQFRRMFRKDDVFHEDLRKFIDIDDTYGPEGPDNWKVSNKWYLLAENMVLNNPDVKVGGKSELMFFKDAPSMLRNYANDLEEEYEPNRRAQRAWRDALDAWKEFGNRQIRTSFGTLLVLNDEGRMLDRADELRQELDDLCPGVRDQLTAERMATLTDQERAAYEKAVVSDEEIEAIRNDPTLTPQEQRLEIRRRSKLREWSLEYEDRELAASARRKTRVEDSEVLDNAPPENSEAAHRKYLELADAIEKVQWIQNYQRQVNYRYWEIRALSESQDIAIEARAAMYNARRLESLELDEAYDEIDPETQLVVINPETGEPNQLPGAREMYEVAFEKWAVIYEMYPDLVDDIATTEMLGAIYRYHDILIATKVKWPLDFPLQYLVDRHAENTATDIPTSDTLELRRLDEEQSDSGDDTGTGDATSNPDGTDDTGTDDTGTGDDTGNSDDTSSSDGTSNSGDNDQ